MTRENKTVCPTCNGKKILEGACTCNMEWRGTQSGDDWDDCQCTPDEPCPTCSGTGYIDADSQ